MGSSVVEDLMIDSIVGIGIKRKLRDAGKSKLNGSTLRGNTDDNKIGLDHNSDEKRKSIAIASMEVQHPKMWIISPVYFHRSISPYLYLAPQDEIE